MIHLFLFIIILLSILMVPSQFFWRPEYFVVSVIFFISILRNPYAVATRWKEIILLFCLTLSASFSIFVQGMVYGFESNRDLMIIMRYGYYIATFISGIYLGLNINSLKFVYVFLIFFTILAPFITILQYFNIAEINNFLVQFYDPQNEALVLGESWRRVAGLMGNPNYWGLILAVNAVALINVSLTRRKFYLIVIAGFNLTAIFTTGSRSAMLTGIIAMPLVWILVSQKKFSPIRIGLATSFGLIVVLAAFMVASYFQVEDSRFVGGDYTTLWGRIHHWGNAIAEMSRTPYQFLIGKGPTKLQKIGWADNMYVRLVRDYGIIGLAFYGIFCFTILQRFWRWSKKTENDHKPFLVTCVSLWCGILVIDMSADSWFVVRIAGLFLLLYGFISGQFMRSQNYVKNTGFGRHHQLERQAVAM